MKSIKHNTQSKIQVRSVYKKTGFWMALIYACVSAFSIATAAPTLIIPQIPLLLASPIHPQVLISIANSQSMDGDLAGAIMTGSGLLPSALSSLQNSSSPVNYIVPTGFNPPVTAANASGQAPYTVKISTTQYDNSASRLNVAKAGVKGILQTYMQSTDFGLETYSTSGTSVYNTWVYYMSPDNANFSFTNVKINGNVYVSNPCFDYNNASSTVKSNCTSLAGFYGSSTLSQNAFMQIGASSDQPSINDVLYAGSGFPGAFITYSGSGTTPASPSPATPYPPNYSLSNYNNGSVLIRYSKSLPSIGAFSSSPTNAGFVPFSPQVMYVQRGFGYYSSQSATSGTVRVPMTTAGTTPTSSSITTAINAFSNYLAPETNVSSTQEIKAAATQSPTAGLLTTADSYLSSLATTSGNGCPQKKYIILLSDGLPTEDLAGKAWPPLGSAAATGYGVTATFNANGSLQSTNCQALTDAVNKISALYTKGIPTYVIGLGAGAAPSLNPQAAASLAAMAYAGGTTSYYPATTTEDLVNALGNIMISVQNGAYTASSGTVSSSYLLSGSVVYQANFNSSTSPYSDWTGNVFAQSLDSNTGLLSGVINWNAQPLLDTRASGTGWSTQRFIATWNPTAADGIPFQWASLPASMQSLLQPSDALGQSRLQYLRGNTASEQSNGGSFRNRSHILGDIINSQALFVSTPSAPYFSSSYLSFATAQASRQNMIYVGSNDGMLHAFNASTGQEAFAYIPYAVFKNLYNLTAPLYNTSHLFFVDGPPQSADVQFSDSSWHTLLVGGENAGGNSIYALDITYPVTLSNESNLANAVLWEFTDSDMGLSYSVPQIAQIGSATSSPSTFAVFFGNGYNSPSNTAVFYAVDPQTGAVLKKINLCTVVPSACDVNQPQGLSSVAVGQINGLQGQPVTAVYAGDLQGNLWAIDVTNSNPANWTGRLLFQARDASNTAQPITTVPVVTLNPAYPRQPGLFIMFGTGQLLTSADLLSTQMQTIYGVLDRPFSSLTLSRNDLQQQTLTLVPTSTSGLSVPIVTASSTTINWINKSGWYNDLPTPGQRVVTNPTLLNGAFVTTINTPPLTKCGTAFSSMLLELNFSTGGSFQYAQFDLNRDNLINSGDSYNGSNPVGIGLSTNSYANAPSIVGPNSSNYMVIHITQSDSTQTSIINVNNSPRKLGWWQLE